MFKLWKPHICSVATEDKFGSNVNMEPDSPTDEDKKPKQDEGKNYLHISVGVFQWGKAGTYSNLQNRAKFCGTQLNPYYQRGGEVFDTQKKEGRVWIRELLPPCVNIFSFAYFFASLILNSRWRFEVHTTKEAKNLHRCELQDQHKSSS